MNITTLVLLRPEQRPGARRERGQRAEDREQSSGACNLIPHDRGQNLAHRAASRAAAVCRGQRGAGHILRGARVHVALDTLVPDSLLGVTAAAVAVVVVVVSALSSSLSSSDY